MNHRIVCLIFLVLFLGLFALGCGDNSDHDTADDNGADSPDDDDDDNNDDDSTSPPVALRAGFSRVSITPEQSVKMAGYGSFFIFEAVCRWSRGVHDPIFATAAAFEDESGEAAVLIILDNVGTITNEVVEIQQGIAEATGISADRVVVGATHNHHGPDTIGLWGLIIPPQNGRDEDYIDWMVEQSVQAGREAWENRVPARMAYNVGEEATYHYNYVDSDLATIDHTFTVLAFYDQNEAMLGTIANWASHPTVMDYKNRLISADYPGAYYAAMEDRFEGVHIYVNGAIGASIQPYDPETDGLFEKATWEDVDLVGSRLADVATSMIETAAQAEDTKIALFETRSVNALVENIVFWLASVFQIIPRDVPPVGQQGTTYMSTFSLGPVRFGTMPGEYGSDYAFELREVMKGDAQILIGLGMDWIGYAITPEQYQNLDFFYERFLCPSRWAGEELLDVYEQIWNPEKADE